MTDNLITWLRAQLDEDGRRAQALTSGGRWRYATGDTVGAWTLYDEHWSIATMTVYDTEGYDYATRMPAARHPGYIDPDAVGVHIAGHDPAQALAEVDANRRIVAVCEADLSQRGSGALEGKVDCPTWDVLTALALPYAGHPGYRDEWRP